MVEECIVFCERRKPFNLTQAKELKSLDIGLGYNCGINIFSSIYTHCPF